MWDKLPTSTGFFAGISGCHQPVCWHLPSLWRFSICRWTCCRTSKSSGFAGANKIIGLHGGFSGRHYLNRRWWQAETQHDSAGVFKYAAFEDYNVFSWVVWTNVTRHRVHGTCMEMTKASTFPWFVQDTWHDRAEQYQLDMLVIQDGAAFWKVSLLSRDLRICYWYLSTINEIYTHTVLYLVSNFQCWAVSLCRHPDK